MNMWQAVGTVVKKYAVFTGTATRAEFWWWTLASVLATTLFALLSEAIAGATTPYPGILSLAILLPGLAVAVRRLRDGGFGWGHIFWILLPIAGVVILLILCAQRSPVQPAALSAA